MRNLTDNLTIYSLNHQQTQPAYVTDVRLRKKQFETFIYSSVSCHQEIVLILIFVRLMTMIFHKRTSITAMCQEVSKCLT